MLGNVSYSFDNYLEKKSLVNLIPPEQSNGPAISIDGSTLKLHSSVIDLSGHLKLVQLFELFINNPQKMIDKFIIMETVYQISKSHYLSMSSRLKTSTSHNVVKLISRARKICREKLPNYGETKYFYFNKETQGWSFAVHQFTQPTFFSIGNSGRLFSIGSRT